MTESNKQLLAAARTYVTDLYNHKLKPEFVFHNLEHTEDVVEASSNMANRYNLEEEDRLVLMLAAWFHDVGYTSGRAANHEDVSSEIATQFLTEKSVDDEIIQRVVSCIMATKMPQNPITPVEKIICDADLSHLASDDFEARNQLLKQERENLLGQKIDKKSWRKSNIEFLENHHYLTDFGQQFLEPKKMQKINLFKKKKKQKSSEKKPTISAFPYKSPEDSKKDDKNAERGVQTMFRTTSANHLELSSMADSKAHILITVNSILLSVMVSFGLQRLPFNPEYIPSASLMVLTSLISVTFSILATRPSVNKGKFTEEDIRNKKTNLLFFGNFHQMTLPDFQWGMNQLIADKEYLYDTMIMDIYYLGVVLARKYKFLRISYTVFMYGLILSILSFAAVALFYDAGPAANPTTKFMDYAE